MCMLTKALDEVTQPTNDFIFFTTQTQILSQDLNILSSRHTERPAKGLI